MLTIRQMAEAHLGNVVREIEGISERIKKMTEERSNLINYFEECKVALANDNVPVNMPESNYAAIPPDSLLKVFGSDSQDDGN